MAGCHFLKKRCETSFCPNIASCLSTDNELENENENLTFSMLCRETNHMVFIWNKTRDNNTYYFVKYGETDSTKFLFSDKTSCSKILIKNLTQNQYYNFQLFGLSLNSKTLFKSKNIVKRTANIREEKTAVKNLTYSLKYTGDMKNDVTVRWIMGEDYSCYYQILFSYEDINEGGHAMRREVDLEKTRKTEYVFKNLDFGKTYEVSVVSFAPYRSEIESPKEFVRVIIPTCSDTIQNLTVCVPNQPENLTITEIECNNNTERNNSFDLKVSWNMPHLLPDYYLVTYILPDSKGAYFTVNGNCSGEESYYIFEDVNPTGCLIQLIARSNAGNSTPVWQKCNTKTEIINPGNIRMKELMKWIWIIIVASVSSLVFFVIYKVVFKKFLYKWCLIKKKQENLETSDKIWESDEENEEYSFKWELIESKLIVAKIIGSGAFGLVQKGFYHSEPNGVRTPVAVKTLKAKPTSEQITQFYAEIEIMKSVPKHAHIVYLIGVVTKNRPNNPLMLVEYCAKGDLLSFLRNISKTIGSDKELLQTKYTNDITRDNYQVFNANYEIQSQNNESLQPRDLLSFARQIVVGMEFLSNLKIVHRDLAARNILVTEDNILKISDFGLSRDVYMDDMYRKVTGGKLPFKWMALESLTHQIYTTESDVWSFGIVLWEIVTLGGNPYPIIKPENLIAALKDGYRMEKPLNCSKELYEIMFLCWQASPNLRPSFKELKLIFDKILESKMQYITFDGTKKTNQYENDIITNRNKVEATKPNSQNYKNVL